MNHPNEAARRRHGIVEHQSDLRTLAPTNSAAKSAADQVVEHLTGRLGAHNQSTQPTGRNPGMTMPRASSTVVATAHATYAESTRKGCDRIICKPGRRCPEHRAVATVHISIVVAQLIQRWAGGRA